MKISTRYISLIGILLFIAIISQTDIQKIYNTIINSKTDYLTAAFLIIPLTIILKGLRWKKIIDTIGLKYSLKNSCKASMIGIFVGTLTPGRSGDLIRTLYLQDENPSSKSLSTIIIDRLLDITCLILFAAIGIMILSYNFNQSMYKLVPIILIPLGLIAILTNKKLTKKISYRLFKQFIPQPKKTYIKECFHEFYKSLQTIRKQKKELICIITITLTIWIMGIIQTYLLITALNINISFLYVLSFAHLITLINLIPISISGIGTRDISMIFFFSLVNIPSTYAISTSFLVLIMLWIELGAGAILWTLNPREIKI